MDTLIDSYYTLASACEASLTIQRSKFITYAYPIKSAQEALEEIATLRRQHYDATHVCWAYALGALHEETRNSDDGEPSGTAGRPILGQIRSQEVSDLVVAVVRYFGGVKLGTGGLIEAYKESARLVLCEAPREEVILRRSFTLLFPPHLTGVVMRLLKSVGADITAQDFSQGEMLLRGAIRASQWSNLEGQVLSVYNITWNPTL